MNSLHSNTYKTNTKQIYACKRKVYIFYSVLYLNKKIKTYFVCPDILALAVVSEDVSPDAYSCFAILDTMFYQLLINKLLPFVHVYPYLYNSTMTHLKSWVFFWPFCICFPH